MPLQLKGNSARNYVITMQRLFLKAWLLLLFLFTPPSIANALEEYQVKAAFIYNFIAFTQWPYEINQSLNFCIYGEDYFGRDIDHLTVKQINNQAIRVLRLSQLEEIKVCQVLFISKSAISNLPSILAFIQDQSILTIADAPDGAIKGVMINMIMAQNRIIFEVNLQSTRNAKLDLSSKLLQLAIKVYQ